MGGCLGCTAGLVDLQKTDRQTSLAPLQNPDRSTRSSVSIPTELRLLVACFSLWVTGFDPARFHAGFVVDKMALGQFFSSILIVACQ
jgi:hypothetical protein